MARNYPADVRLQSFYTENYTKESSARLDFWKQQRRGGETMSPAQKRAIGALPTINPSKFAREMKMKEDEENARIVAEARNYDYSQVMRKPNTRVKAGLYDGFTKEEKGRYQYLKSRHMHVPEAKYTYPVLSSMEYGWQIQDRFDLKKSPHAMSNVTSNSFYTRSGVPDLANPSVNPSQLERGKTMLV
jgi:hypothetical protein